MDRGRRGSLMGSSDPRKRGRPLPPVSERSSAGPYGQMLEPQKFGGSMIPAEASADDHGLVIDPNLLVGPLYTDSTDRKTGRIKEQLTDITEKLHRTLHTFDEFADFEQGEDPLVGMMRRRIQEVDDPDMQFQLSSVMGQYEDMAHQLSDANKERDEMLLQLADWFTTDHVDLDDIKTSVDESDEQDMKNSYFETVTNFERLKKLQQKIAEASVKGKPTRQLEKKKFELEKDVVDKFKIMKDMSMQTMKLKISDDAPWKHAANEIVSMLKNVRSENAEELAAITKNMKDMIDQLEKQALTIKSLTAELREKKEVVKNLTDENGDLSQDVAILRARYMRYEKDLDAAKQMIRSLHMAQMTEGGSPPPFQPEDMGKDLSKSISKVLARFDEKEPERAPKRLGSDPAMLRTQIRDLQDDLDCIRSEYSRKADEIEEMSTELQEKREYIQSIEDENEKFSKELKKLRQQRRQSIAAGIVPPAEGEAHQCEHCKCHIPEKDIDEEIEELKREVKKWQDKCNYFKKTLADTEMKLSEAFKEISDLRMDRETVPEVVPDKPKPKEKVVKEKEPVKEKEEKPAEPPSEPPEPKEPKEKAVKPAKAKKEVKPRYLQQKQKLDTKLPPIEKGSTAEEKEKLLPTTAKESREFNLYKVGDLQGKLNMIINEIMEFVTEVGRMLHTEKDETKKVQAMTAFTFENNQQKKKETVDPKEQEARQKKTQVLFNGQHAVSKLREAFDMLSNSLGLQHQEYEAIYRSFKISQQRHSIRREIMYGRMPVTALQEFDMQMQMDQKEKLGGHGLLASYYSISYGTGGAGMSLNKPRTSLHRKTSSISSIRSESPETEAKLKETMHVLSMQRSKSDLDVRPPEAQMGGPLFGAGLIRERSQIILGNVPEAVRRESVGQPNKQEVKISKAVVPRKGLIQLSTDDHVGFGITGMGEKQSPGPHDLPPAGGGKTTSLIKRKDILDQIRQGNKLLEEYEEQKQKEEEMSKSLGEYTMLDLQSRILEMTDAKSVRRRTSGMLDSPVPPGAPPSKQKPPGKKDKTGITLPAIKQLNPFGL